MPTHERTIGFAEVLGQEGAEVIDAKQTLRQFPRLVPARSIEAEARSVRSEPFGGELRRLVTGRDGLNNLGSQERQPQQSADVMREDPSRSAISATDLRPASKSSDHCHPRAIAFISAGSARGAGARLPLKTDAFRSPAA